MVSRSDVLRWTMEGWPSGEGLSDVVADQEMIKGYDDELVGGGQPAHHLQHRPVAVPAASADVGEHQEALTQRSAEAGPEDQRGSAEETAQHEPGAFR